MQFYWLTVKAKERVSFKVINNKIYFLFCQILHRCLMIVQWQFYILFAFQYIFIMGNQPSQQKLLKVRNIISMSKSPLFPNSIIAGVKPQDKPILQQVCQLPKQIQLSYVENKNQSTDRFNDPRRLVEDPLVYPYSTIGLISFKKQPFGHFYMGTGFLVEKNILMTAAHNLYDRIKQKKSIQVEFWPSLNGLRGEYYKGVALYYPQQYQYCSKQQEGEFDYGLVQLEESISDIYGSMGLNFEGQTQGDAEIAGYPSSIYRNGSQVSAGKKMYIDNGQFSKIVKSEGKIRYNISTSKGQSGSPIYKRINDNYYVVGIHTNGGQGTFNEGVLLTLQKMERINKWVGKISKKLQLESVEIGDEEIRVLVETEKIALRNIKQLNLMDNKLGPDGIKHLISGNFMNIHTLNICNNQIGPLGCKYLANGRLLRLINLNLGNNKIDNDGVLNLVSGQFPCLQILNLMDNRIDHQGAKHISLGNLCQLNNLNLRNNKIDNQGIKHLASGKMKNMKYLDIGNNRIGSSGIEQMVSGNLENLTYLNLFDNEIRNEGAKHLANGNLRNLKTLDLDRNEISNQGVKFLAFGNLFNLTTINITDNKIGPIGAHHLASGKLTNLTTLNLHRNQINNQGAKNLSNGNLIKLSTLHLLENNIGPEGAKYLASGNLMNLAVLNLWNNIIQFEGAMKIAQGNLKKLNNINISCNEISNQQKIQIQKAFRSNYKKIKMII